MKTEIKICGLTSIDDVFDAGMLGANYLGFILFPGSKRFVTRKHLRTLVRAAPATAKRVGVFVNAPPDEIFAAVDAGLIDIVQLHGDETPAFSEKLSEKIPVWKYVYLQSGYDIERAAQFPAARILVDSAGGGTGIPCDWALAAQLAARREIMLAGGITPENACAAVRDVRPAGIDIASGAETRAGVKSFQKMKRLFSLFNQ